ncbi:M15 family metallopeptidase [Bacillus sp. CGMCC 1.60114]|uniref:M15 family metallopeptidase n=1 Tax=unclassified Bacillus (in: firmicutes) TaxID=185979 RepID=UPI00362ACFEA
MRYHTRNMENLEKLAPHTRQKAKQWYQHCLDNGVEVLIYETLRSYEKQKQNVASGASQTMKSYHLVGQALDFVPITSTGKEDWNGYWKQPWYSAIQYAKQIGFEWGGDWKGFCDSPHLQYNYSGYGTDIVGSGDISVEQSQDKPLQTQGIGIATSKYPEGWGVNYYSKPVDGWYTGKITDKTPYLILEGYWKGGNENRLCLGWQQWAKQEHFDVQWFYAYSKYPVGYGINTYDAPNGNYTGKVDGSVPYGIYARKDGYIDIGQNRWVSEEHFNIK